jgi:hypothetical protein
MISGLVAKTVRISCSLHADRANSITRFFGTHLVGAAVEFLQSFALHRWLRIQSVNRVFALTLTGFARHGHGSPSMAMKYQHPELEQVRRVLNGAKSSHHPEQGL